MSPATPAPFWKSSLLGTITLNGRTRSRAEHLEWVDSRSLQNQSTRHLLINLIDEFHLGNQELPLDISIRVETQSGHGQKYEFVAQAVEAKS